MAPFFDATLVQLVDHPAQKNDDDVHGSMAPLLRMRGAHGGFFTTVLLMSLLLLLLLSRASAAPRPQWSKYLESVGYHTGLGCECPALAFQGVATANAIGDC